MPFCGQCGTQTLSEARFCGGCGNPVSARSDAPAGNTLVQSRRAAAPPAPAQQAPPGTKLCQACGGLMDIGRVWCRSCGHTDAAATPSRSLASQRAVPDRLRAASPAPSVRADSRPAYRSAPYAGRPHYSPPSPPPVTRAHYLWPVFFGIVGGLLGYFLVKDRDEQFAKRLLITGGVISAAYLLFLIIIYVVIIAAAASYSAAAALGG